MAAFFALAGANHFAHPAPYLRIMPPYLPLPLPLVYLSGLLECAFGIGLLLPPYKRAAAWALVALLFLVFPANIHMALHPELYPRLKPALLWLRLPMQFALMGLVLGSVRGRDGKAAANGAGESRTTG